MQDCGFSTPDTVDPEKTRDLQVISTRTMEFGDDLASPGMFDFKSLARARLSTVDQKRHSLGIPSEGGGVDVESPDPAGSGPDEVGCGAARAEKSSGG